MPTIPKFFERHTRSILTITSASLTLLILAQFALPQARQNPIISGITTMLFFGLVLFVMGMWIASPAAMMKMVSPQLDNISEDLQVHLAGIGVESALGDVKDYSKSLPKEMLNWEGFLFGVVRVKDRSVESVEIRVTIRRRTRADALSIKYIYATRGSVEDGNVSNTEGDGGSWSGGRFAEVLNSDNELKMMMREAGQPKVMVKSIASGSYIAIFKDNRSTIAEGGGGALAYGVRDYPSRSEFEVYGRIAQLAKKAT